VLRSGRKIAGRHDSNERRKRRASSFHHLVHGLAATDGSTGAACGAGGKAVQKASPDDPKRPGWPKGTEGGKGGQFRPKTDAERFGVGGNNGPPLEGETSPSGKIITRALAGAIQGAIRGGWPSAVAGAVSAAAYPYVNAYFDPPKSLEDLQRAAQSPPEIGYDDHHIVERATAAADGSENALIAAPENLARIPTVKHWHLNRWYDTPNRYFNDMTPRQYLKGKSWDERYSVALDGLRDVGVLQ
jgi:hypothetical protein